MITTVPAGTCAWAAKLGAFRDASLQTRGRDYERFVAMQDRASDWVLGASRRGTDLYEALTGELVRNQPLWYQTEGTDPYRLALIGGDLLIPLLDYEAQGKDDFRHWQTSYRFSTTEEAAEALRVMEGINERLESGEEALQPFARDIRAYLDFYRSVKPGEEELVYGHT